MHKNRKKNEHVENFVFDVAAAMCFRRTVLQCSSILHLEAAVRNPNLYHRQVHGCCKADVK